MKASDIGWTVPKQPKRSMFWYWLFWQCDEVSSCYIVQVMARLAIGKDKKTRRLSNVKSV